MTAILDRSGVDGAYAWRLALVSAFCICLGGGSIYLPVVALKEIALLAGFADQSHFQRAFKQRVAMTPRGYQRAA
jgi:AraC-like DNA-binding protein